MASTSAPRRRRICGTNKTTQLVHKMVEETKRQSVEEDIKTLVTLFRADHSLLEAAKAVVASEQKGKSMQTRMVARGVRTIKDCPAYLVRKTLAQLVGVDETVFANLPDIDNQVTLWWTMGGNKELKVPRKNMTQDEWIKWCKDYSSHTVRGRSLSQFDFNDEGCDLDFQIGVVNFYSPTPWSEVMPSTPASQVIDRDTKKVATLPEGFRPTLESIGGTWQLLNNYTLSDVYLKNSTTSQQIFLSSVFLAQRDQDCASHVRACMSHRSQTQDHCSANVEYCCHIAVRVATM